MSQHFSNKQTRSRHAYSNPTDAQRSIIHDVSCKRTDDGTLSRQAITLFNTDTVFPNENERIWMMNNMRSVCISVEVAESTYEINGIYRKQEGSPVVLFLHGFGSQGNWANWIKMAYQLFIENDYSVIFIDLPGFGQSSGQDLNQSSWKPHGPDLIVGVLSSLSIKQPVNVVAHCGGAATIMRTMIRYPHWFQSRGHVFTNAVIGDFGEKKDGEIEEILSQFKIRIKIFWIPDRDHLKSCAAYKRWNRMRQNGFPNLKLVDLDPTSQTMKKFYPTVHIQGISRGSEKNEARIFRLSEAFVDIIVRVLRKR